MAEKIDSCCAALDSNKLSERRKSAESLRELIGEPQIVALLNQNDNYRNWNSVYQAVQKFIRKECEKLPQDEGKKGTSTFTRVKNSSYSLLQEVVAKANSGEIRLSVSKLLDSVLQCFESFSLKKYFGEIYLTILVKNILPVRKYWGQISGNKWQETFFMLKNVYINCEDAQKENVIRGLYLVIKHGSCYSKLSIVLRQEFAFIKNVCGNLESSEFFAPPEIIKLLLTFCLQVSKDCRMASCKLGEDLTQPLLDLYKPRYESGKKSLIFDFLLLQVRLHHPKGALKDSDSAYAYNWTTWKALLKKIYSVLYIEVDVIIKNFSDRPRDTFPVLESNFLALFTEVSRQVFHDNILDITQPSLVANFSETVLPVAKKARLDIGITALISELQAKNNWAWLCILNELLSNYPDTIQPSEFVSLLETLVGLQVECKDSVTRHYLYKLLSSMVQVQESLPEENFDLERIESLWVKVWESTLRSVGLNQSEETTHQLLQVMINHKKCTNPSALFSIYTSGVLNFSIHSIRTLNTLCKTIPIPEVSGGSEIMTRKYLINLLLGLNKDKTIDSCIYSEKVTAQVLIGLTMKNWPFSADNAENVKGQTTREIETIETIYSLSSFEAGLLLLPKKQNKTSKSEANEVYLQHSEAFSELSSGINLFCGRLFENQYDSLTDVMTLIDGLILILYLLSDMISFGILKEETLKDFVDYEKLFRLLNDVMQLMKGNADAQFLKQLQMLFSLDVCGVVSGLVRREVSVEFLKILFDLLNVEEVDGTDEFSTPNSDLNFSSSCSLLNENLLNDKEKLQLSAMRVLSNYCCLAEVSSMNQKQKFALETLVQPNFDPMNNIDFHMTICLLEGLVSCKPGLLTDNLVECIINSLQSLMEARYEDYDSAILLLWILRDSLPHVAFSNLETLKGNALILLGPFFQRKNSYGPEVHITIAGCVGVLAKVDPLRRWPNSSDVISKMVEFLKCDYHEVRLSTIRNISEIFSIDENASLESLKRQKELFADVSRKVIESFSVSANLDEDQEIDEAANRTSSALHTYASLIAVSPFWRKQSLFALVELITDKKLNTDLTKKVLNIVETYLEININTFLEENLNYLITNWCKMRKIIDFPFNLLQCQSTMELLTKHLNIIIPVLLQQDNTELLGELCHDLETSMSEMIKGCFPNVIAQFLPVYLMKNASEESGVTNEDIFRSKRLFRQLSGVFGADNVAALIAEMLDKVYSQLLKRFFHNEHFETQFGFSLILPQPDPPFYNYADFSLAVNYIEKEILGGSIAAHCIKKFPSKLEQILLEATVDIHRASALEEKLTSLHRYSILVDYIIPELQSENQMKDFLVRSITHNLINLIKLFKEKHTTLSIAACKYFQKFCSKILVNCSEIFEKKLSLIVSTLVPIAKLEGRLSEECTSILNFVIGDNSKYLYNSIGALDPFPGGGKFQRIQWVYEKIKYGNDTFSLEQEIDHFLKAGSGVEVADRTEGLQHLRMQLASKKGELANLYAELQKVRGFCDDCERSILHRLICMLVKLTNSGNSAVRLEAARCLGELGPADLTTLVLKPERIISKNGSSNLKLVTGRILVLLSQYLVDQNIAVAKAASDALYVVLASKEGKSAITAENLEFESSSVDKSHVMPFIPAKSSNVSTPVDVDEEEFRAKLNRFDLWCPTYQRSHSEWITTLVSELLKVFPAECFLQGLVSVCQVKVEFSEELLPLLIYLLLCQNEKTCTEIVSRQIQQFFANHWQGTMSNSNFGSLSQASTDSVVVFNKASVQCMLNVVHFIRLRQSDFETRKALNKLNLNYLHVAQGAQFCSAYFTSILYGEIWCYDKLEKKSFVSQSPVSTLCRACENEPSEITQAFENMLREGYKKIGDMDAIHGCGSSYILNTKSRIEYYKNLGQWDKVILYHDCQLENSPRGSSLDLTAALKNNSLHYLATNFKTEDLTTQFECAWRLNRWNITDTKEDTEGFNNGCGYEKYHYFALKSLHDNDQISMNQAINQARSCVIKNLSHASLESSKSIYAPLAQLQMLQDLENMAEVRNEVKLEDLVEKWKKQNDLCKNQFEYTEPIKAQRITMLFDIFLNENAERVRTSLADLNLELAHEARTEGFYHVAQRALNKLSYIEPLTPEIKGRVLFEQAQLSWLTDKLSGRYLLRHLLDTHESVNHQLYGEALKLYGNWMVETRSENPTTIIENYFQKSLEVMRDFEGSTEDAENRCEVLDSLARFADSQYQQVSRYIESSSFESKVQTVKKFKEMATKIKKQLTEKSLDEKRAMALYERLSKIDQTEVDNAHKEKELYLNIAITSYLRILESSDSYNFKVFRILSLSLANKTNQDLLHSLKMTLPKISSYKFIPLLPQLVPHIGNSGQNDAFEMIIQELLEKCATDHPHHTLPIILALADSYKDRNFDPSCSNETVEPRVQTAKDLIVRLKKKKNLASIIKNMELVSTALISLAYMDSTKCLERKQAWNIPRNEPIRTIRNLENILLPTISIKVRKNRNYDDIIGIVEFSNSFSLVGGVNAPKKISCKGTDGIQRAQLVKGKDDLRQDAVMQQVFNIMNNLLAKNKQTSKLLIRTYKVVPLSQRSGIIEWCENTEPLGNYLTDAHKKYHPADWTPADCRAQMRTVHSKDHDAKFRKYKEVCERLRPVFHMFFISSYPQPTVWFERRRAYMHSVATSSMVGYILGLGDRHVQNILLDKNTAEVIHIDFGIAFEQGRVLPTPETVPFRLTRDIESGMGICSIEGVFRRSCEKTMQVLRQNAETVLTILEVLLYDPLYVWTITPAEAYSRQRDEDIQSFNFSVEGVTPVNVTAERALLRLKQKLEGTENGGVCSVEGQVELLLQQARDPVNLSRLFNGWQAYL